MLTSPSVASLTPKTRRATNLKDKFQDYLNEIEGFSLRSERFAEDVEVGDRVQLQKWLEAAFMQGARVLAQDTLETLQDYGTAVAGLNEPVSTPTRSYDAVAENLTAYYATVLGETQGQ